MSKNNMMHPMVYEKTRDGEMLYDIYSRLVKERIIYLSDEICAENATTISATMLYLDRQSSSPIKLYLNSPGGTVDDGLFTIYDTMNYIKSPVHTVCIGTAYSAAALILAAGSPGERKAFENSAIMIHEIRSGSDGPISDMKRDLDRTDNLNKKIIKYLALHTNQKESKIEQLIKHDTYFDPEDVISFGLIDGIIGRGKKNNKKNSTKK